MNLKIDDLNAELDAIEKRGNRYTSFDKFQDINSASEEYIRQFNIFRKERDKIKSIFDRLLSSKSSRDPSTNIVYEKIELEFKEKTLLIFKMHILSKNKTDIHVKGLIINSFKDPEMPLIRTWYEYEKPWIENEEDRVLISRLIKNEIGDYEIFW